MRLRQSVDYRGQNKTGSIGPGGRRCDFANYAISAENDLSDNPHFGKSTLSRDTQWDFIAPVDKRSVPRYAKAHRYIDAVPVLTR